MVRISVRRNRAKIPMRRLGIYRTQIQPKPRGSYGNKICQASYRVAREENNTSQHTLQRVINETNFTLSFIQRANW